MSNSSNSFVPEEIPDDISSIKRTKTAGGCGTSVASSGPIYRTLKMSNHEAGNDVISNTNGIVTSFALFYSDSNLLETAVDAHKKTQKDGDILSISNTQRQHT